MKKFFILAIITTVILSTYTQARRIAPSYTIAASEIQVRHTKPIIHQLSRHIGYGVTTPPGIIVINWGDGKVCIGRPKACKEFLSKREPREGGTNHMH